MRISLPGGYSTRGRLLAWWLGWLLVSLPVTATADICEGQWVMPDGSARLSLFSEAGTCSVRIVALREPLYTHQHPGGALGTPRLDDRNPDKFLRSRPLEGLVIGTGFRPEPGALVGGRIYDPDSGRTYRAEITRADGGLLRVRGYVGVSLLGKTMHWIRAGQFREQILRMLDAPYQATP